MSISLSNSTRWCKKQLLETDGEDDGILFQDRNASGSDNLSREREL